MLSSCSSLCDGFRSLAYLADGEILYAQHIERNGKLLFEEVCERNLEGMVAKRRMSVYAEHGWLKIKNPRYTQGEGRQDMFKAFHERTSRT